MSDVMDAPLSFRGIIELWASREAMAFDLGLTASGVSKWWQRDSIPDEWWATLLTCPRVREAGITADSLVTMAARPANPVLSEVEARP